MPGINIKAAGVFHLAWRKLKPIANGSHDVCNSIHVILNSSIQIALERM